MGVTSARYKGPSKIFFWMIDRAAPAANALPGVRDFQRAVEDRFSARNLVARKIIFVSPHG
jgi:hypothetical protein